MDLACISSKLGFRHLFQQNDGRIRLRNQDKINGVVSLEVSYLLL